MLITIFTATYNRESELPTLYNSLVKQKVKNFEWIVVDDGSTDGTSNLMKKYIEEGKIPISYVIANHGGKHRAINRALEYAKGELFFSVDSDDYLTDDATQQIELAWATCADRHEKMLGLCMRRINAKTGEIMGALFKKDYSYASPMTIHYLWNIKNDKAEIFRTKVCKEIPFPEFEGENFCTEALWVFSMAQKKHRKLLCVNRGIRFTEYLDDGLTCNYETLKLKNPKGYMAYYKKLLTLPHCYIHPKGIYYIICDMISLKRNIQNEKV